MIRSLTLNISAPCSSLISSFQKRNTLQKYNEKIQRVGGLETKPSREHMYLSYEPVGRVRWMRVLFLFHAHFLKIMLLFINNLSWIFLLSN